MDKARRAHDAGGGKFPTTKHEERRTDHHEQRALANQPWKEYTAEGGRKYWYNTETKQSSWEMPEVYKNALAQTQPPPRPAAP